MPLPAQFLSIALCISCRHNAHAIFNKTQTEKKGINGIASLLSEKKNGIASPILYLFFFHSVSKTQLATFLPCSFRIQSADFGKAVECSSKSSEFIRDQTTDPFVFLNYCIAGC